MKYLKQFIDISPQDAALVGGKGMSLGIMTKAGLPVPPGFVVTTATYKDFAGKELPAPIQEEIFKAFDALATPTVAIRSSAISEDSPTASWAGQLETYLHIRRENIISNIQQCWKSAHSQRALAYASRQGTTQNESSIAVVIQKMVTSELSGVMFSANPINKKRDEIMIEAVYGLGELLVQGMVTPANFILDKHTLTVKSTTPGHQETMLIFDQTHIQEVPVPEQLRNVDVLTSDQLTELGTYAVTLETLYNKPQDIEWAQERSCFYIVQSRPITTL